MTRVFDNYDWSIATSLGAFVLAYLSNVLEQQTMEIITGISAGVLCLTAIVKFIDLLVERIPIWREKIKKGKGGPSGQ